MATSPTIPPAGSPGIVIRVLLSLFLGAALLIGSAITYLFARGIVPGLRTHLWRESACRIVESRVAQGSQGSLSHPFVFEVLYQYELGGRAYESRVYSPGYRGSDQVSRAQSLADRFPPGSETVCYVDPAAPQNACLDRPSLWIGLLLLLPLFFVAVGLGGMAATWWPTKAEEEGHKAISERAKTQIAAGCVVALFSLLLLVSLASSLWFAGSAFASSASRSWSQVPCVVLSSEVRRDNSSERRGGPTFSIDILYEYEVGGRTYRSNRYDFFGGSSSGYSGKAAVVAQNPPGSRRTCFVNPSDPKDAVFTRGFGTGYWFVALPLVFAAVGIVGIIFLLRGRLRTLLNRR